MIAKLFRFRYICETTCLLHCHNMLKSFYFAAIPVMIVLSCSRPSEDVMVIGVSQCSEDLWRETVNSEIRRQASVMRNVEVRIKSVKDDSRQQIKDIREFMHEGVDLMIVSPNESEALTPVVSEVYRSGIPVILFDRKTSNDDYTAYVGADNHRLAGRLGYYVADLLHGEGNVVIIRGLKGSTADEERYEGFMEAIAEYPDIHVVGESFGEFLKDHARMKMDEILQDQAIAGDIDLVFAMNDQMAMGVRESYDAQPWLKVPVIIGIDAVACIDEEGGTSTATPSIFVVLVLVLCRGCSPGIFQNMLIATVTPAITIETMLMSFIRMLSDGPEVSLKGSPTVSPTTVAA